MSSGGAGDNTVITTTQSKGPDGVVRTVTRTVTTRTVSGQGNGAHEAAAAMAVNASAANAGAVSRTVVSRTTAGGAGAAAGAGAGGARTTSSARAESHSRVVRSQTRTTQQQRRQGQASARGSPGRHGQLSARSNGGAAELHSPAYAHEAPRHLVIVGDAARVSPYAGAPSAASKAGSYSRALNSGRQGTRVRSTHRRVAVQRSRSTPRGRVVRGARVSPRVSSRRVASSNHVHADGIRSNFVSASPARRPMVEADGGIAVSSSNNVVSSGNYVQSSRITQSRRESCDAHDFVEVNGARVARDDQSICRPGGV